MPFPGTITLPEEFFMKVTEYAARSFKVNGFKDIVLIGDSGPNQKGLQAIADLLNKEWASSNVRVHFVPDYYRGSGFGAWLRSQGETPEDIGTHAGISDTSQLMALNPSLIRTDKLAPGGDAKVTGVSVGKPHTCKRCLWQAGARVKDCSSRDPNSEVDRRERTLDVHFVNPLPVMPRLA
jgi:creatinine amidohydrolase